MGEFLFNGSFSLYKKISNSVNSLSAVFSDLTQRTSFEKVITSSINENNLEKIRDILVEYHKSFPQSEIANELLEDISSATRKAISVDKSYDKTKIMKYVQQVLYNFEVDPDNNKRIIRIDDIIPFELCKEVAQEALAIYLKEKPVTPIYPFVVSSNKRIVGRVIQGSNFAQNHVLLSISTKTNKTYDSKTKINYIDEQHPVGSEKFVLPLFTYTFVSTDSTDKRGFKEYILLSQEKLSQEEMVIDGFGIPITDSLKVGNTGAISINTEVVFVLNYSKVIQNLTEDEFLEECKNYTTHEELYKEYFTILRQPLTFEKFLLSMMFARKGTEGYPSHIGLFGPASCGKSKLLEAVSGTFGEIRLLETTTLKSIVPNFGSTKAEPGLFIKSRRYCTVDELLNMLIKGEKIEEMNLFNSLLTHANGTSGSGKHQDVITAVPTATMIFATNYKVGRINNFVELCDKIDVPFLSRFILYNYTRAHVEFIKNNEDKVFSMLAEESAKRKKEVSISDYVSRYNPTAIRLTDYLRSTMTFFNQKQVSEIYSEVKEIIPDSGKVLELYEGRSRKHIATILDGVIKYHYIIEKRTGPMEAKPIDYEVAKDIWYMIVSSWSEFNPKLPMKYREKLLTEKETAVFLHIAKNPGTTTYMIDKELKFMPHSILNKLLSVGLIRESTVGSTKTYTVYNYIDNTAMGL